MYLSLLFWLALAIPGFAILRRFARDELDAGFGAVAPAYLATFVVLSPGSIACYVLRLPTEAFSAFCAIAVVWGILDLSINRGWRAIAAALASASGIGLVVVLADMALGAWNGSFFGGDAKVHVARIRFLVDNGFSNLDPFIEQPFFFPIYHTNLLHALYAACSKLTGIDPFGVWYVSLAWGKLLNAGAAYYLAWQIFSHRGAAWAAAIFCIGARGPIHYAIYPNQLAPFWVLPVMMGAVVRAMGGRFDRSCIALLAGGSLVLGQLHGMYAVFAAALLGPLVAGRGLWCWIKRRDDRVATLCAAAALLVGIPFVIVSQQGMHTVKLSHQPSTSQAADDPDSATVQIGSDYVIRDPVATLASVGGPIGLAILLAALIVACFTHRRAEVLSIIAIFATTVIILYVPPVATALVNRIGEPWILSRLEFVFSIGFICIVAPAVVSRLEPLLRWKTARGIFLLAALPAGAFWSSNQEPLTWKSWLAAAKQPAADRHRYMTGLRTLRDFLAAHVPPGRTILTHPQFGMDLVQAYDCHAVVSVSAGNGVPDMAARFDDLYEMLANETPWERRRELLGKYGVEYFTPSNTPINWTVGHVAEYWTQKPYVIARLRIDG